MTTLVLEIWLGMGVCPLHGFSSIYSTYASDAITTVIFSHCIGKHPASFPHVSIVANGNTWGKWGRMKV